MPHIYIFTPSCDAGMFAKAGTGVELGDTLVFTSLPRRIQGAQINSDRADMGIAFQRIQAS